MLLSFLTLAAFASGAGYLFVMNRPFIMASRTYKMWKYILKPGTMCCIILIASIKANLIGPYAWLILLGLCFSLLGDIFLMLPSDRFLAGLLAFFCAHVAYIVGFFMLPRQSSISFVYLSLLLVIASVYFVLIQKDVKAQGGMALQIAVVFYITIISLMLYVALMSKEPLLIVGAFLFCVSDGILAWNRFVKSYTWENYGIIVPYFLAQYLFALSIWLI